MMHKLTFRAMLLGGVCLLPLGAWAADLGAAPAAPAPARWSPTTRSTSGSGESGRHEHRPGRPLQRLHRGGARRAVRLPVGHAARRTRSTTSSPARTSTSSSATTWDRRRIPAPPPPSGSARPAASRTAQLYEAATANDLGPNAEAKFDVGDQGKWGVIGYYDAISYTGNIIDSIYTINGNQGVLNSPLVPWGGATVHAAGRHTGV